MSNLRDDDQRADSPAATAEAVLEYLAREIVDQPDHVTVEASERRRGVELRLLVDPADLGRVIGKRGRTAQAIRAVVKAAGQHDGVDVSVDIVD